MRRRRRCSGAGAGRTGLFAWCTFDWANSAFPTVIVTFVFAAYFAKGVAADEVSGTSHWSFAISLSMLATALLGPLLGAVADHGGRRKPWVFGFTVLMLAVDGDAVVRPAEIATSVWWILALLRAAPTSPSRPGRSSTTPCCPTSRRRDMIGRVSGWGWGLGYIGGLVCLVTALFAADPTRSAAVRPRQAGGRAGPRHGAAGRCLDGAVLAAVLPADAGSPRTPACRPARRCGAASPPCAAPLPHLRHYKRIALFLLAHMIYADGLNTLFAVGGIYAAVSFGMDFDELLLFGIALNVTAGAGAFAFGWVDDAIGAKRTILIALAAIGVLGAGILLVETKTMFWAFALPMGIFLGPTQSASRSLMARIAPPELVGEMFGLFALSGKATAFMGPALFGWVTALSGSQRIGLSTILVFLGVGAALLLLVREQRAVALEVPLEEVAG